MAQIDAASSPPRLLRRRKRRHPFRVLFFLLALLAAALSYPPVFRPVLAEALRFAAWEHRARWTADGIDASLWRPWIFTGLRIRHRSLAGTDTTIEIAKARAVFSWRNLFWNRGAGAWRELALTGVRCSVDIPATPNKEAGAGAAGETKAGSEKQSRLWLPAVLDVRDAEFTLREKEGGVLMRGIAFRASEAEPGDIRIASIEVRQPWLSTQFTGVRGTVARQDARLTLADMPLAERLVLQNASANLPEMAQGRLRMDFSLAAFGGTIRGELKSSTREEHLNFESAGTFSSISVGELAAFLGEDADGTIREGKFTFHGSPRNWAKATISTRLEAGDFRWGRRQWNSLVLGFTAVNRRVLIPELLLRQAHNTLSLRGDADIPGNWRDWWQGNFQGTIAAKIDNLSELSALFGPGFADIAGKLSVEGEVRGEAKNFTGEISIAGSRLSYRSAPLDELHAAVKLNGNEIQVSDAALRHGADFVRGHGVVNILGEKRYWGELNAAVAELALYSDFMQPSLAPRAFSGGLALDWSGDGTAHAHSGAFSARLKKIRPLDGPAARDWHPLNLDAEATYLPDNVYFSRLVLADAASTLSAKVIANPAALTLQDLRLEQHGEAALTGEAVLPLNLWAVWRNADPAAWWSFNAPCRLALAAQALSLHDALLLGGREVPVRGEAGGSISADGTLARLALGGELSLKKFSAATPLGNFSGCEAEVAMDAQNVALKSARGVFNKLQWEADGAVLLQDVRAPELALAVRAPRVPLALSEEWSVETALTLQVSGPAASPKIGGSAELLSANLKRGLSGASLVKNGGIGIGEPLAGVHIAPHREWPLDVAVTGSAPLKLENSVGTIAPELRVTGTADAPRFDGRIDVAGFPLRDGERFPRLDMTVDSGSLFLHGNAVEFLALQLSAKPRGGAPAKGAATGFDGWIFGATDAKQQTWTPCEWADDAAITEWLANETAGAQPLSTPLAAGAFTLDETKPAADVPLLSASLRGVDEAAVWTPVHVLPPMPEPPPATLPEPSPGT